MLLRIKEFREEMQLTQKELAVKIDNVQRNVSNWENGTSEPDCETIVKLAEVFEITIDELFGRDFQPLNRQATSNVDNNILKAAQKLTDSQKFTLMQFLRELNNE